MATSAYSILLLQDMVGLAVRGDLAGYRETALSLRGEVYNSVNLTRQGLVRERLYSPRGRTRMSVKEGAYRTVSIVAHLSLRSKL